MAYDPFVLESSKRGYWVNTMLVVSLTSHLHASTISAIQAKILMFTEKMARGLEWETNTVQRKSLFWCYLSLESAQFMLGQAVCFSDDWNDVHFVM